MQSRKQGFTLIELLIVIGMLAILLTAAVLILNPAELNRKARDSRRISDIDAINKNIDVYNVQGGLAFGSLNTVYISLPHSLSNCYDGVTAPIYSLPTLPSGWSYACSSATNYTKVDGTGWIPIDLASVPGISPSKLAIDPINSDVGQKYYSYVGGSWEVTANLESAKHLVTGSQDGGDSLSYEAGTDLKLLPTAKSSFDFSTFPTTSLTNQPAWRNLSGSGSTSVLSESGENYLRASNGQVWYQYEENIPFNPNAKYKLSCRVRQIQDPTTPSPTDKKIYCGVTGVASNGTTYINTNGLDTTSSQHYIAASADSLTAGAGYTTFTGYFKGHGTPAGGKHTNPNDPAKLYPGIAYIRPMFILNYSSGNGVADIDFEMLEVIE